MAHILGCFRFLQLHGEHCSPRRPLLLPLVLLIQDYLRHLAPAPKFPRMCQTQLSSTCVYTHAVIFLQGAQTLYFTVLRPVLANVNKNSAVVAPSADSTAEGLRERVATATE